MCFNRVVRKLSFRRKPESREVVQSLFVWIPACAGMTIVGFPNKFTVNFLCNQNNHSLSEVEIKPIDWLCPANNQNAI